MNLRCFLKQSFNTTRDWDAGSAEHEFFHRCRSQIGLLHWVSGKESACNAANVGSILGSGRSPGEGKGNPLQYFCLENSMDKRSPGRLQFMGSQESDATQQLNNNWSQIHSQDLLGRKRERVPCVSVSLFLFQGLPFLRRNLLFPGRACVVQPESGLEGLVCGSVG